MNICVIPARGGSKRIPGKNIRLFIGKPIIAYSIETARASGLFDKIIVSTEDEKIKSVAKAYGAKIHNRAKALADDVTGTQEVMRAALAWWASAPNTTQPEFACCIYATAPLMTKNDLRAGMEMLRSGAAKYVYTVGPDGKDAGQWYFGRPKAFLQEVPLEGNSAYLYLPADRVCDINVEDDWQRAERMYAERRETEKEPMGPNERIYFDERPMTHVHKYELVPATDKRVPELTHFRCACGHILPT